MFPFGPAARYYPPAFQAAAMPYSESSASITAHARSPAKPSTANVARTAIPITLTSINDPSDQRSLTITHGSPTLIGRASRSETKKLQPSSNNALFDCPVISREHAELRANQWAAPRDQVTLMDKGSMHGTQVNGLKLERFKPIALRQGDRIQFGTRVSRGQGMSSRDRYTLTEDAETDFYSTDTHDGVTVTYDRVDANTQNSNDLQSSAPNPPYSFHSLFNSPPVTKRGYHVPYASDEESDIASDDDFSILSDDGHETGASSAKTTPEQAKSKLGSAERPIDIESDAAPPLPRRPVIHIEDDDDDDDVCEINEITYCPQSPVLTNLGKKPSPKLNTVDLVEDSIDQRAEVLVPESVPTAHRRFTPVFVDDHDEESVADHNTGLTGLLNAEGEILSDRDDDGEDSDMNDGLDYPDEDDDAEESDGMSVASDLSGSAVDALFEDDEPLSYSAKKQASPELGSAPTSNQAPLPASAPTKNDSPYLPFGTTTYLAGPEAMPKPPTQQPYDPVRASAYGFIDSHASPHKTIGSASQPYYKPYTYAAPTPSGGAFVSPHANVSSSSRWDIAPDYHSNSHLSTRSFGYPSSYSSKYASQYDLHDHRLDSIQPFGFTHEWSTAPDFEEFPSLMTTTKAPTPKPVAAAENLSSIVNKISVGDLIEADVRAVDKGAEKIATDATAISGKKRTFDEMATNNTIVIPSETINMNELSTPMLFPITPVTPATPDDPEPPARRRKVEGVLSGRGVVINRTHARRNVARGVAKYTAAAAVGAASTMAFFMSPLAERFLEWLG